MSFCQKATDLSGANCFFPSYSYSKRIMHCSKTIINKPSRYQKSAKNGSERYLMFGTNHNLVKLMWDDGRFSGHGNISRWFLNIYRQLLGPSKLINRMFRGRFSKWNTRIYNPSFGPHMTHFSEIVAKKRKYFE